MQVKNKAVKISVIGSGQAGSRVAESFYKLGYNAVAINTAAQDLKHIQLPESHKLVLEYGLGGASKDLTIGQAAAEANKDAIYDLINDKIISQNPEPQMLLFTTSLGGGSGAGSIDTILGLLSQFNRPVLVITILPMSTEDAQTQKNALDTLASLTKELQSKRIYNLIVVDNAKIETLYSDVSQLEFYPASNQAIVEPFDAFNVYSAEPSSVKPLDPMEFVKILIDGEGLTTYGTTKVFNYRDESALSEAVMSNNNNGLLASGFDLKQVKYVGMILAANKKVWQQIPHSSVDYAVNAVKEAGGNPVAIFQGIYETENNDDAVQVFTIFSGLSLPDQRIQQLKTSVLQSAETLKVKEQTRSLNLNIDTGHEQTISAADKVREKIANKKSPLGAFLNQNVKDRRK